MSETPEAPSAPEEPAAADTQGHGDEIHMPPNSYWPLVASIGLAIAMVGIILAKDVVAILAVGIVVLLTGVGGWVRDARREYQELP